MFTGLVEALGTIRQARDEAHGRLLRVVVAGQTIDLHEGDLKLGDSVAINGVCLTVVSLGEDWAEFQAGPETLRKTNLGQLRASDRVNLERALRANGRLDGHIVQGHIDGLGTISSRTRQGEWETVWFHAGDLTGQMVPKGSVAVDGISLTVVDVTADAFSVALIPHTMAMTTLGFKTVGARVNLETDILGKYVLKYLGKVAGGLSLDTLRQAGFMP